MRKIGDHFQKWREKFKNKFWLLPSFISKVYKAAVKYTFTRDELFPEKL